MQFYTIYETYFLEFRKAFICYLKVEEKHRDKKY